MTRTTIDLDPVVVDKLKQRAKSERKSMGQKASEILAVGLDSDRDLPAEEFMWKSADLGLQIDLQDKDRLYEILDKS